MKPKILFGIDVETDVGSFTPFYDGVKQGVPFLLQLFKEKQVKGTFYFTGDAAKQNPEELKQVLASDNEVGCHSLYHETVGDALFPIPGVMPLLYEEVPLRLKRATEWIEEASGQRPKSFRCPRLWASTAVLNALEDLGYTSDASYPMYYFKDRLGPYHPSKSDWTKEGELNIVEIPNFADLVMTSHDPGLERDRDQWPLFRTKNAAYLMDKVKKHLAYLADRNIEPVLCFYFHPWEFIPCKTRYRYGEGGTCPDRFLVKGCGTKARREIAKLIDELKSMDAEFLTAAEIAQLL